MNILSEKRKMDVNVSMAEIYWHQSDDDAGAAPQWVELFSEGGWGLVPSMTMLNLMLSSSSRTISEATLFENAS